MRYSATQTQEILATLPTYIALTPARREEAMSLLQLPDVEARIVRMDLGADDPLYGVQLFSGSVDSAKMYHPSIEDAVKDAATLGLRIDSVDAPETSRKDTSKHRPLSYKEAMHNKMVAKYGEDYHNHVAADFGHNPDDGSIGDGAGSSGMRVGMSVEYAPEGGEDSE